MNPQSSTNRWTSLGPELLSVLRIAAGLMFTLSGTMKICGYPSGMPDGVTVTLLSQMGIGGLLELVGGALMLVGLFTRPVAFILAGEMAVAYFQFHQPQGFWPVQNGGVAAALYSFVWLYFSAAGGGAWSLDRSLRGKP